MAQKKEFDPNATENSESILVRLILQRIIRRWWLFAIIGAVAAAGGFIYAFFQKPVYESYLSFALDEGGSEGGGGEALNLAAQFGISLGGGGGDIFTGDNILEIMQSRRLVEGVLLSVDTFNNRPMTLIEFYLQQGNKADEKKTADSIHFYPGENPGQFSYGKKDLLYQTYLDFRYYHIIARRPDKRLNIYELMVSSEDEKFSKIFTDKLIDVTNRFYTELRSKKSRETLVILEKRVPEMKVKLDQTIANKAAARDANLNPAFAIADVPLQKAESNTQVYGAAYAEMFKNLELARFQYLRSIPLMQIIDPADYPMKKTKPGKIKTAIVFAVIVSFIAVCIFVAINIFRLKRRTLSL